MTSTTLIYAVVAGLVSQLVGDEPNPVVGIRTKADHVESRNVAACLPCGAPLEQFRLNRTLVGDLSA